MAKSAILVVSFGTSVTQARRAVDNLVNAAKLSCPDHEVRLAFTSRIIREKISRTIPNPVEALASLNAENFTRVIMIPTLIIPGKEYDELRKVYEAFRILSHTKYGFEKLTLAAPFMNSPGDCEKIAEILAARFDLHLREKNTGVVLMGHGTRGHFAHALYAQLQLELDKRVPGKFFVGTVEASPMIQDVAASLKTHPEIQRLILSPLMITAGEHANNDLAGTWVNILKSEGWKNLTCELTGLGEDENMTNFFVTRLCEVVEGQNSQQTL